MHLSLFTAALTSALFASASASLFPLAPLRPVFRRDNSTDLPQTTLTVSLTETRTITSCSASVTNCPARGTGNIVTSTELVTSVVTVCPVAEASSASAAIVASHSAAVASSSSSPAVNAVPIGTTSQVLTYTLGTGSSISTTVITVPSTIYSTPAGSAATPSTAVPLAESTAHGNAGVSAAEPLETEFTTVTSTSTITFTVTVQPTDAAHGSAAPISSASSSASASASSPLSSSAPPAAPLINRPSAAAAPSGAAASGAAGKGDQCPQQQPSVPSTVTVTQPAVTVTVTVAPLCTAPYPAQNGTKHGAAHHSGSGFATFTPASDGSAQPTGYQRRRR